MLARHDVVQFDISVHDSSLMEMVDSFEDASEHLSDFISLYETVSVGKSVKGHVQLFSDHIDAGLSLKDGIEPEDIFVIQTLPYSELFEEDDLNK